METLRLHSDDLVLLDRIVSAGTLAGAARVLELAPPAVTKRLAALESRLGVRLVERSTRRLRLTAEGASTDIHHIVLDFGNAAFAAQNRAKSSHSQALQSGDFGPYRHAFAALIGLRRQELSFPVALGPTVYDRMLRQPSEALDFMNRMVPDLSAKQAAEADHLDALLALLEVSPT